jgi:predicted O-methyltransferase YrrM
MLPIAAIRSRIRRHYAHELYDVTPFAAQIDLQALRVIETAPMWMSRAERLLIYTLAFTLRPQRYLEIGTFQGGSALVVCAALDALQSNGRLTCIDPEPRIAPEHWRQIAHRTTLHKGYSPQILAEASCSAGGQFDLTLIDGDHSYAGALRDAIGALPYLQSGGYMLFHDCFFSEVERAINDFIAAHGSKVIDCGALTREVTYQTQENGAKIRWGGLRLLRIV